MPSCKEATRLISLAQEKKLGFWESVQLKIHVLLCKYCSNFQKNTQFLSKISQAHKQRDSDET